jgi:hypothetical protein
MAATVDLSALQDPAALNDPAVLRNLIEELVSALQAAQAEIPQLRDENNRLKGEQGKPRILASRRAKVDQSSEQERRESPKRWHKRAKLPTLAIDRTEVCRLERSTLPDDAVLKDYQEHTVQDLVLRPETILFRRERYAAASTGQPSTAPLPAG